ncbi:MAG: CPBP family intramembrane glutamic endopeptidase [Bacteriovoracaceae bacterium]|nr:CPBP family intramembrane metalloprotease [Bacteroidota bacterium]
MNDMIENEAGMFQSQQTKYSPSAFAFAALGILFALYQFVGGGITLLFVDGVITKDNVTAARLATMLSQIVFLLVPTIYLAKRQHGRISEVFRWRIPSFLESFLAVAGMVVMMQLSETYLYFQSKIPLPEQLVPIINALKQAIEEAFKVLIVAQSVPELLFVTVVAALTPAICEELMFRGLIQKNFSLAYGSKKGFLLAGAIFGIYHLNPFWLVPLVSLGIYFSFLQYRSKTLLLPIAVHFINNAAATVGVFLYGTTDETTPTIFLGTEGGPSDSIVLGTGVLFAIIFFLIIVQYIKVTDSVHYEQGENDYAA